MWSNSCIVSNMRSRNRTTFLAVFVLGVCIITFLLAYAAFGEETTAEDTLMMAQIVFRHGDRTPSSTYPNDPYNNHKYLSIGLGELTIKGKRQMYELGLTLKKRYDRLLGGRYSRQEVEVRSSAAARCQMSAQVLLAGMFPPIGDQIWNQDLLWQPIPVNSVPRMYDNVIASKANCPTFTIEKFKSDSILNTSLTRETKELFIYLTENTGYQVNNISTVESLYNLLTIQAANNLSPPKWSETVYPEPLRKYAGLNLASFTRTPILKRLQAGPMLSEWVKNIGGKIRGGDRTKLYLYSGHDLTLVNSLRGLSIEDIYLPQYGAALIVELHNIHEHYFVKLFYYPSAVSAEPKMLSMPGCDDLCSIETFLELLSSVVPTDWEKECRISPSQF